MPALVSLVYIIKEKLLLMAQCLFSSFSHHNSNINWSGRCRLGRFPKLSISESENESWSHDVSPALSTYTNSQACHDNLIVNANVSDGTATKCYVIKIQSICLKSHA